MRVDPKVVGRHQAAGGIVVVGDEFAQIVRRLAVHLAQQLFLTFLRQVAEQIGRVVGVHLFDDVGGALGAEIVDDRTLHVGVEVLERVGSRLVVERADDPRRVLRRQLADDVCQFGGVQPREPVLADRQPDLGRIEVVQRRDVVPRDQRTRHAIDQARDESRRTEPAQQPADPDVGGDHAQRAGGARDLDVVDPHDLAAVDVDDLLVEQILDQVERLVVGRPHDARRRQQDECVGFDVGDFGDRGGQLTVTRFDDHRVHARKRILGVLDDEVGDLADVLANTVALDEHRPADKIGDEPFVEGRAVGLHPHHPPSRRKNRSGFPRPAVARRAPRHVRRRSPPQRRASAPHAIDPRIQPR